MRLYYHTLSAYLLECLQKLMTNTAFDDFVLVGGTALSIQLGHRMSNDIDLFAAIDYGSMNLEVIKNALTVSFPYIDNLEAFNERMPGYSVYIGNSKEKSVKLDLYYTENFIMPNLHQDGLRLASLQDIAGMKIQAIVNNKRKKDFWDIHELLEHFTIKEMIQFGLQRNPFTLTENDILQSLYYAANLNQDNVIECLKGKYWELIVEDLRTIVENETQRFK